VVSGNSSIKIKTGSLLRARISPKGTTMMLKLKAIYLKIRKYIVNRLRFGVDIERTAFDIEREFSYPFLDEGSVLAWVSPDKKIHLKIGRRTLIFDQFFELMGTECSVEDESRQIFCNINVEPYEVAIKHKHLEPVANEMLRLAKKQNVHADNWYRFTIEDEKNFEVEENV
jgi:hypothetical protein